MIYDLLIIGAGPAGLAAALDASYLKLKTLILDAHKAGGALTQSYPWKLVDSYLGFRNMLGNEVAEKMITHVREDGVDIREMEEVLEVKTGKPFKVITNKGTYESHTILIATGVRGVPRKLGIPGEKMDGVGPFVRDPKKYQGKNVVVVGGGDSAVECALGLSEAGANVSLIHRRNELRAVEDNKEKIKKSQAKIFWNTEVKSIEGTGSVEKVILFNTKNSEKTDLPCDHVFVCIGFVQAKDRINNMGIKMDGVRIEVDGKGMTSVPGVFAAGDIIVKLKRIPQALATGETAAFSAFKLIRNPYWK